MIKLLILFLFLSGCSFKALPEANQKQLSQSIKTCSSNGGIASLELTKENRVHLRCISQGLVAIDENGVVSMVKGNDPIIDVFSESLIKSCLLKCNQKIKNLNRDQCKCSDP